MKSKRVFTSVFLASAMVISTVIPCIADTVYRSQSGNIDSYDYSISIHGSTTSLSSTITYYKPYDYRYCSIDGTYVSAGSIGRHVVSAHRDAGYGGITVTVNVPDSNNDRFVEASSTYSLGSWTTQLNCTVQ